MKRIPIFKQNSCCFRFFEVLTDKIITYLVMPDHFHLILNPQDGDIQGFARRFGSDLIHKCTNNKEDYRTGAERLDAREIA